MTLPVVPAFPGFISLQYFADEDDENIQWVERIPIVAWVVDAEECSAVPVTPDQDPRGDKALIGVGILFPDGRVIMPYRQIYADENGWRRDMLNNANQRLTKKKKKSNV